MADHSSFQNCYPHADNDWPPERRARPFNVWVLWIVLLIPILMETSDYHLPAKKRDPDFWNGVKTTTIWPGGKRKKERKKSVTER